MFEGDLVTSVRDVRDGDDCVITIAASVHGDSARSASTYLRTQRLITTGSDSVRLDLPLSNLLIDDFVSVRVTRRVDSPDRDEVGAVRGRFDVIVVKVAPTYPERGEKPYWLDITTGSAKFTNDEVARDRLPLLGAVPNSRAFFAQQRAEREAKGDVL